MVKLSLSVSGMKCEGCARKIETALRELSGTAACRVELGRVSVTFDESKTSKADLFDAVRRAGPFDITGFTIPK